MDQLMMGMIAMASWVAGLFFLRFWRDTRDRLFLIFAVAFWLLGGTRIALALMTERAEHEHLYWVRLLAFVLILVAIIDKNWPRKSESL
jgi:uncharacterized membrane protein YoaK (UPF0700 family)